jgi:translation elongation factor EF-Ts
VVVGGALVVAQKGVGKLKGECTDLLKATGTTVSAFTLYVVGEGIEKKVDDFAAEVAAQVAAAQGAA